MTAPADAPRNPHDWLLSRKQFKELMALQQVIRDAACQLGRMGAPPGDGSDALLEDILIALEASQTLLERATAYDRRPFQGVLTTWSPPASYGRSEEDEE